MHFEAGHIHFVSTQRNLLSLLDTLNPLDAFNPRNLLDMSNCGPAACLKEIPCIHACAADGMGICCAVVACGVCCWICKDPICSVFTSCCQTVCDDLCSTGESIVGSTFQSKSVVDINRTEKSLNLGKATPESFQIVSAHTGRTSQESRSVYAHAIEMRAPCVYIMDDIRPFVM
jgi:hypothetical protein